MHFISRQRLVAVAAAVLLAGAVLFLKAFPRPAAVKPVLQRVLVEAERSGEPVPVIVELEEGIFRVLSAGKGDALESVRGFAARLSVEEVRQALELDEVVAVHFDAEIRTGGFHAKTPSRKEERKEDGNPFLKALGADQMHRWGLDGTGISVAVVDSGIADLLGLRVVERVDFTGDESDSLDPYGHGTHVAGILGRAHETTRKLSRNFREDFRDLSRASLVGVAPGVDLVDVRVIDSEGKGRTSTLIQALEWIRGNADRLGIRVVNLSLGHPPFESYRDDPLGRAVEGLIESGLVVVASAGNLGKTEEFPVIWGAVSSPANHPGVIAVSPLNTLGTVTHSDDVATSYGSRGPAAFDGHFKPDITAPGNRIPSLLVEGSTLAELLPERVIGGSPQDAGAPGPALLKLGERLAQRESPERPHPAGSPAPVLFELSGASMAVPFVSGTVAIMLQANPELGPGLVKSILQLSAVKLEQPHMLEQGNGLVNTRTAVELALSIDARTGRLQLSTLSTAV